MEITQIDGMFTVVIGEHFASHLTSGEALEVAAHWLIAKSVHPYLRTYEQWRAARWLASKEPCAGLLEVAR